MTSTNTPPAANAIQRQIMDYLRSGAWKMITKLPVSVGFATLDRLVEYGWIERRGQGPGMEIKLMPAGLLALRAPV